VLDPNIKQRFADLGAVAVPPNSPDEFAKFIAENIDKWTKVIKFAASSRSDRELLRSGPGSQPGQVVLQ
jgi:Tripartite tricarboxylate transporter family receptor.